MSLYNIIMREMIPVVVVGTFWSTKFDKHLPKNTLRIYVEYSHILY